MKIISVLNAKGGVGKTTTSVEIAFQLGAVHNKKILSIDMDPQGNYTHMLTGETFNQGLYDLLIAESWYIKPSEILKKALNPWKNVVVLPADRRLGVIEPHLASKISKESILKDLLKPLSFNFDFAIIDLPPAINTLTLNALACSDSYIIPTDVSEYSKSGIQAIIKLANTIKDKKINENLELAGIFFTGFQKGGAHAVRSIIDDIVIEYKEKVLDVKIPNTVKVIESQQRHIPVSSAFPESSISVAYNKIVDVLIN